MTAKHQPNLQVHARRESPTCAPVDHSHLGSGADTATRTRLPFFSFPALFSRRAAVVISGTELARQIQREIQRDVEELVAQGNMRPHLGVVLVGEDPASRTYVKNKTRAASILGKMCTSSPC